MLAWTQSEWSCTRKYLFTLFVAGRHLVFLDEQNDPKLAEHIILATLHIWRFRKCIASGQVYTGEPRRTLIAGWVVCLGPALQAACFNCGSILYFWVTPEELVSCGKA